MTARGRALPVETRDGSRRDDETADLLRRAAGKVERYVPEHIASSLVTVLHVAANLNGNCGDEIRPELMSLARALLDEEAP